MTPNAIDTPPSSTAVLPDADYRQGLIELYGPQDAISSWLAAGWIAKPLAGLLQGAKLQFADGSSFGPLRIILYERPDVASLNAVGFIVTAERLITEEIAFNGIALATPGGPRLLGKADEAQLLEGPQLAEFVQHACAAHSVIAGDDALRQWMGRSWTGQGFVEVYGYHSASEGLFVGGWASNDWAASAGDGVEITARFGSTVLSGPATIAFFERDDVYGIGLGFVAHLPGDLLSDEPLASMKARARNLVLTLSGADQALQCEEDSLTLSFGRLVDGCKPSPARRRLQTLLSHPTYTGDHTLASLPETVLFDCDALINAAPDSIVMLGWLLAKPGVVKQVLLCSRFCKIPVDFERRGLVFPRPDVITAVGEPGGFTDPRCGFLVRVPPLPSHGKQFRLAGPLYLEIHTVSGAIGFAPLPEATLEGTAAIRKILADVQGAYNPLDAWFDDILGPPIAALRGRERREAPKTSEIDFGAPPSPARYALVVPLIDRLDAMEIQVAQFAAIGLDDGAELIYVLDDPDLVSQAKFLAHSVYERFRVPLRLITLDRRAGFTRAANIGLAATRAPYVCLLNEAMFPTGARWLARLAGHLEADPKLGAVVPLLLFEDGSVQHQGYNFKPSIQYANWYFPWALRKGFRPEPERRLHRPYAVAGSGVMLRRSDAIALGGFDEAYIAQDFTGTDLCLKLRALGKHVAIDSSTRLYHLEREAEVGRFSLSLYDAWVHQRRWAATLAKGGF